MLCKVLFFYDVQNISESVIINGFRAFWELLMTDFSSFFSGSFIEPISNQRNINLEFLLSEKHPFYTQIKKQYLPTANTNQK